jgi:hypothetical protein
MCCHDPCTHAEKLSYRIGSRRRTTRLLDQEGPGFGESGFFQSVEFDVLILGQKRLT